MIITDPEILKTPCQDVAIDEVGELVELLERELERSAQFGRPGIGLAAPQIGIFKKAAIVRLDKNGSYDLEVNLINAKVEKGYDPFTFRDEGCLSFPDQSVDTIRYNEVHIVNNLVSPNGLIATGLFAVACQHELDHLNSILMFDRQIPKSNPKNIGPNDPCFCGKIDIITGKVKKFKKCCRR